MVKKAHGGISIIQVFFNGAKSGKASHFMSYLLT